MISVCEEQSADSASDLIIPSGVAVATLIELAKVSSIPMLLSGIYFIDVCVESVLSVCIYMYTNDVLG